MAEVIIVEGPSGTGKSTSLRNIDPTERKAVLLVPNSKPLPFKGGDSKWGKKKIHIEDMNKISSLIDQVVEKGAKLIFIEDFSHFFNARILSDEFMAKASGGAAFERWKVFARDVMRALFLKAPKLPDRVVLHSTVLPEKKGSERFVFQTQLDELREAKSPMGMFEEMYIPNDMAIVLDAIEEYDKA